MRLNAFLARAGIASRRGSDELIKAGRVRVNDLPGALNTYVHTGDRVEVDGIPVTAQALKYVLLNKPAETVTTASDPQGRPTVVDLVEEIPERVVPVGRLDADTTGALLLTNDGPLAHRLAHPRYGVEKVYEVETWKEPNDEALQALAEGVELEDGVTSPARIRRLGAARFELVLHEGRNRQVRRMCEACKRPYIPDAEQMAESGIDPSLLAGRTLYSGEGCIECSGTGFKGRMAICELLDLTDRIREMILEKRPTSEIKKVARDEGMRFLRESAVERVLEGVTTLREINKVTFVE